MPGLTGEKERDVHRWIKKYQGPQGAAAELTSHFLDRAGRFTFALDRAISQQPLGGGALALRSRGVVVTPVGVPRYVLQCLGYPEEKIEAAIAALHGPKWPSLDRKKAAATSPKRRRAKS